MSADCRPPAFADEGSVNLTRYHHPALRQVIDIITGMAGFLFQNKKTFSRATKRMSLYFYPKATSRLIISEKPETNAVIPFSFSVPFVKSPESSENTTKIIAPAAKESI